MGPIARTVAPGRQVG